MPLVRLNSALELSKEERVFDEECYRRYGSKTCMLYQISVENFELQSLDYGLESRVVRKSEFYELIPRLIEKKYTVVIVEQKTVLSKTKEITTVHFPVQSQLAIPPII